MKRLWQILIQIWVNVPPLALLCGSIYLAIDKGTSFFEGFSIVQALFILFTLRMPPLGEAFKSINARSLLHGLWISFAFGVFVSGIKTIVDDAPDRNWILLPKAGLICAVLLTPYSAICVMKNDRKNHVDAQ